MIMKNEEDWLPLCLSHVKDLVDEMIIVDTGSTDASVEIAKRFGAKVLYHQWVDDFAKVRNYSLQHAQGDWILVLDADEILEHRDHQKIRKLIQKEEYCYLLTQRHYTNDVRLSGFIPCRGEHPEREKGCDGYFESALGRLFPNFKGIHYRGAVHELIEYCLDEIEGVTLVDPKITLHHYGHTNAVKAKKDKSKLYTPLGEKKVNDENRGWKEWFELAVEHNNNRRINESIVAFEESLRLNPQYESSWVNYGYVLCEAGRYDDARNALLQATILNPQSEEAYCNLGVVALRVQDAKNAEQCFRRAVQIKPNYVNAWRNLSIALSMQNRFSESALVLQRILSFLPYDHQSLLSLGSLYLHFENAGEALKYFSRAYEKRPTDATLAMMITQSLKLSGEAVHAIRFLSSHIKVHNVDTPEEDVLTLKKFLDKETTLFLLS